MFRFLIIGVLLTASGAALGQVEFVEGSYLTGTTSGNATCGGKFQGVYDYQEVPLTARGGGGQTSGGIEGIMDAGLTIQAAIAEPPNEAGRMVIETSYHVWVSGACEEGNIYTGAYGGGYNTLLLVPMATSYYVTGTGLFGLVQLKTMANQNIPSSPGTSAMLPAGTYRCELFAGTSCNAGGSGSSAQHWRIVFAERGDVTGNGNVNIDDLLAIINGWGACSDLASCITDINGDNLTNIDDLLLVINNWG